LESGLALDRLLHGGLARGALHEIVAAGPGDAGAACGFALALAARCVATARAPIVWILDEAAQRESGLPYAPGLAAHGLDPSLLILVRTRRPAETLWASEEALKCRGLAAVVTDLWATRHYDLVASRRLILAAARGGTPGFLVAGDAAGHIEHLASAAHARFEVKGTASPPLASAAHRIPLPGPAAWAVRLARIRAGPEGLGGVDTDRFWPLVWDHTEARFCDALPLPVPALPADRSDRARDAA
jgi:protein ImuA